MSFEFKEIKPIATILVVEDDENILNLLSAYLESAGHRVVTASDGDAGLNLVSQQEFDLCVFDVMLPNRSGTAIAKEMRDSGQMTPVLFLSALGNETDILRGFGVGADDYMVKPFSPRELLVRIEAVLRRSVAHDAQDESRSKVGPIQIDEDQPTCSVNGHSIELTPYEHRILLQLLSRPGRVLSRSRLIASIYGNDYAVSPKAIDVHVHNLRAKLGDEVGVLIRTVRGFGYKFLSET